MEILQMSENKEDKRLVSIIDFAVSPITALIRSQSKQTPFLSELSKETKALWKDYGLVDAGVDVLSVLVPMGVLARAAKGGMTIAKLSSLGKAEQGLAKTIEGLGGQWANASKSGRITDATKDKVVDFFEKLNPKQKKILEDIADNMQLYKQAKISGDDVGVGNALTGMTTILKSEATQQILTSRGKTFAIGVGGAYFGARGVHSIFKKPNSFAVQDNEASDKEQAIAQFMTHFDLKKQKGGAIALDYAKKFDEIRHSISLDDENLERINTLLKQVTAKNPARKPNQIYTGLTDAEVMILPKIITQLYQQDKLSLKGTLPVEKTSSYEKSHPLSHYKQKSRLIEVSPQGQGDVANEKREIKILLNQLNQNDSEKRVNELHIKVKNHNRHRDDSVDGLSKNEKNFLIDLVS